MQLRPLGCGSPGILSCSFRHHPNGGSMRFALTMLPAVPIFLAAPVIPPAPAPTAPAATAPAATSPAPRAPSGGQAFPFPVKQKTLPNGLKVYVVAFDSPGLVAYYSVVRTGSRNEVEPGKSGFAHFFEHLMFRGSENYTAEKYNAVIKE